MVIMNSSTLNRKKFKAAVLFESKKPLKICSLELPEKLEYGQVLVQVKYSGICGAQINEIDAVKGKDKFLPHLLGHEGSGIVKKIGEGVTNVSIGDHVVMHWKQNNSIQSKTPTYKFRNSKINAGWVTTFNEYAVVSENRLTTIPKNFDLKIAPLFGCSITTAFGVINNDAKLKIGQSIAILGTGGVGLNIVQAANLVSAYPILGVDINNDKLKMAKTFGSTDVLKFDKYFKHNFSKKFGTSKFDIVVETTGKKEMIELAYEMTSNTGKTILVGVPSKKVNLYTLPLHFEKTLTGSHGGGSIPEIDITNYIRLMSYKKLNFKKLITHQFNLSEINKALKLFRSGKAGRIIIKVQ